MPVNVRGGSNGRCTGSENSNAECRVPRGGSDWKRVLSVQGVSDWNAVCRYTDVQGVRGGTRACRSENSNAECRVPQGGSDWHALKPVQRKLSA